MRAVIVTSERSAGELSVRDVAAPQAGPGEVVISIAAAGVNRADLLQRKGQYPSPPGWPEWPGLECSGIVAQVGKGVDDVHEGNAVCALVGGGAYADAIAVPADLTLPVPHG
ncbi:MAG TPA: alcohol dehydrogenase catalytic domain-containing protein, partial [Demequina sp.]|nr:alcohol dehydrogenase catalytic domain-containing protein [Demequina sp.]